jgi:phosphoribosylanthranilate isomerase
MKRSKIEIKICGLGDPAEAMMCADAGADAIGLVFYPRSPRCVSISRAAQVTMMLPPHVTVVGVFVDEKPAQIIATARQAGFRVVQLHGAEPPQDVKTLQAAGLRVIKALRSASPAVLAQLAASYAMADGFLAEGSAGPLPGGNGVAWQWSSVVIVAASGVPVALAGGLTPANVLQAVAVARPSAVDVSSGVELRPGRKDIGKVRQLIHTVRDIQVGWTIFPVFCGK